MNRNKRIKLLVIVCAAIFMVPSAIRAETNVLQRGSFPGCQQECPHRHVKQMEKLEEQYAKTHDGMVFQDGVAKIVSEYFSCVENCREPHPVK